MESYHPYEGHALPPSQDLTSSTRPSPQRFIHLSIAPQASNQAPEDTQELDHITVFLDRKEGSPYISRGNVSTICSTPDIEKIISFF